MKARNILPDFIKNKLWGDRKKWGRTPNFSDSSWLEWQRMQIDFYNSTQKKGIGDFVNDAGYSVMSEIDLTDKCILEIGPGEMKHQRFWNSIPEKYIIADIHEDMMKSAIKVFERENLNYEKHFIKRNQMIPIPEKSVDIIVSFYSFEHLHPFEEYIQQFKHYLKPNGVIIGAIPAEGGFLWGLGRFLTSRRWVLKNTSINYDKLICWEHPNYADFIIKQLDFEFSRNLLHSWPLNFLPLVDTNLVFKFCYINNKS